MSELSPLAARTLSLRAGIGRAGSHSAMQVARILRISNAREARIERSALITLREVARDDGCAGSFGLSARANVLFVVAIARTGVQQAVGGQQGFPPFAAESSPPVASSGEGRTTARGGSSARTNGPGPDSDLHGGKVSSGKSQGSGHGSPSVDYAALHAPSDSGGSPLPIVLLLLLGAAGVALLLGPDIRRAASRRRNGRPAVAATTTSSPPASDENADEAMLPPSAAAAQAQASHPQAGGSPFAQRAGWVRGHRSQMAMILASLGGALQLITRHRRAHHRRRH